MKIIFANPPLFDLIAAKFKVKDQQVIFAWGDTIYNPKRIPIGPELLAHEVIHGKRQARDIEGWWHRYLEDPEFRLQEELLAHRAEFWRVLRGRSTDRKFRDECLTVAAKRLINPLYEYGRDITLEAARRAILGATI